MSVSCDSGPPAVGWKFSTEVTSNDGALPVTLPVAAGRPLSLPARVDAFVNLHRADARGIHMSRLYRHLDRALSSEPLSPHALRHALREFLDSHADLSDRALLRVRFDLPVRRTALASDTSGWRLYPVALEAQLERHEFRLEAAFEVLYSSTCPSSAALARQVVQERLRARFHGARPDVEAVAEWLGSGEGMAATPHAQRSAAEIRVRLLPSFADLPPPSSSILRVRPWHEPYVPAEQRSQTYGWRNPGGVGRMAEYYPPGNQFQLHGVKEVAGSQHRESAMGLARTVACEPQPDAAAVLHRRPRAPRIARARQRHVRRPRQPPHPLEQTVVVDLHLRIGPLQLSEID